jgi:subtilisin family serine protease
VQVHADVCIEYKVVGIYDVGQTAILAFLADGAFFLMSPLELVKLTALMERTSGSPEVKIGFIDGPVAVQHADLAGEHLREIPGNNGATCTQANSTACLHGTFIAGILSANRNSVAPAICPNCTLVLRPIFTETTSGREHMPSATPLELAAAIIECIDFGARVINLSLALAQPSTKEERP